MKNLARVSVIALAVLLMTSCASTSKTKRVAKSEKVEFKALRLADSDVITFIPVVSKEK